MDQIQHKYVDIKGLKLHISEIGTGEKVVLFLHGFPEIWFSWRYQMIAAAKAGYRAIAIDFRGYGESEIPSEPEKATYNDFIDDVIGILDFLEIPKVFIVGKDFGAQVVYSVAILYPERVLGVVALAAFVSAAYMDQFYSTSPQGFYTSRWMIPGRAEADFSRFDVKTVIKKIYILFSGSTVPIAEENQEIMDLVDSAAPLPSWFKEEDLSVYASLYEKSGFRTPLTVPYRVSLADIGDTEEQISAPTLLIIGGNDYVFKFPGMKEYLTSGAMKYFIPNLDVTVVEDGSHFVQEQFPDIVNEHIISFLGKH